MIKNKTLYIKIIFKIKNIKNIKNRLKTFQFSDRLLFYKISYNTFQKLFFKIVTKHALSYFDEIH